MKILISRTDGIGDVVLTLPLAGAIKRYSPESQVIFMGRGYTEPIISLCEDVDEFLDWDEAEKKYDNGENVLKNRGIDVVLHVFPKSKIAKLCAQAAVPLRIGTSHRLYNWLYCNRLAHFSRRNSDLHESVLNFKLLDKVPNFQTAVSFDQIADLIRLNAVSVPSCADGFLERGDCFNLILHPKSKGSAREWGLANFKRLIESLDRTKFRIFVCGTEAEGLQFRDYLFAKPLENVYDLSGKLSLPQYISLIAKADALVAASTGPLHIAAVLGRHAIGLFPPIRPMNPTRWQPIGKNVKVFCKSGECDECRKTLECRCMQSIEPKEVAQYLIEVSQKLQR